MMKNDGPKNPPMGCNLGPKFPPHVGKSVEKNWQQFRPYIKKFKLTGSESHTLERLNKLIGEDTLAFVKAKEDFKRNKNSPGILYSDVIRQSFKSVPYFHYAEDSR